MTKQLPKQEYYVVMVATPHGLTREEVQEYLIEAVTHYGERHKPPNPRREFGKERGSLDVMPLPHGRRFVVNEWLKLWRDL